MESHRRPSVVQGIPTDGRTIGGPPVAIHVNKNLKNGLGAWKFRVPRIICINGPLKETGNI